MFRNIGFGAAAVLAVGALAIGCSDDGDTIVGGNALLTDNFPGNQIFENNVADDGKAFTNQGQNLFNDEFEIYWNVTDGHAVAVFQTRSTVAVNTSDTVGLYTAHFDGNQWASPVRIFGRDLDEGVFEDPANEVSGYKFIWINTAGDPTPEVSARNGDGILIFSRNDLNPAPSQTTNEDPNRRVWMTYFDRSAATAAAAGTVVRGFNTNAIVVDDELIITSAQDPSVGTFGFVSDSHLGTHEYSSSVDEVASGQPTTFVSIVYAKQNSSTEAERYLTKSILGDAPTNDLATLLGAEEEILAGDGALVTSESVVNGVSNEFYTHNELMLWNATRDSNGGIVNAFSDNDVILTATTFDSDGPVDSELVGNGVFNNDATDEVEAQDLYGPDHSLAAFYVVYTESGFQADSDVVTSGSRDGDTDVFVAQIDADDALTVQTEALEVFADTITFGSFPTRTGANTGVSNVESRLNRSTDFITVLFNETNTDVVEASSGNFNNVNQLLYVAAVQTRRAATFGDTDVRALADSVVAPVAVPSFVATGTAVGGTEADVTNAQFQQDLVESDTLPQCAIQSNANRVNFTYQQFQDTTGTTADLEDLLVNGIDFVPGVLPADTPDFDLVDTSREVVATRDGDEGVSPAYAQFQAIALDAGDSSRDPATNAPTGESGRVLVFFILNGNNPTSGPSETASAFHEPRLFVYDQTTGDTGLVSTDGPREFDRTDNSNFSSLIEWETVPVNEDFVNSPHHAGTTLHVFWVEDVNDGPAQRLMTRSYSKSALNDGDTTNDVLDARFTPNLTGIATGADPVQIDNITDGPLSNLTTFNSTGEILAARSGSTVGIYFAEDEHIYFSDTTGDATLWDSENGIPAPQLIDNDSLTGSRVIGYFVATPPECDDLPKSMVVFSREEAGQAGNIFSGNTAIRAYIRIHN